MQWCAILRYIWTHRELNKPRHRVCVIYFSHGKQINGFRFGFFRFLVSKKFIMRIVCVAEHVYLCVCGVWKKESETEKKNGNGFAFNVISCRADNVLISEIKKKNIVRLAARQYAHKHIPLPITTHNNAKCVSFDLILFYSVHTHTCTHTERHCVSLLYAIYDRSNWIELCLIFRRK